MSYLLPHLGTATAVNDAIAGDEDRVVVVRWGSDADPTCMIMDETLYKVAERVKNFAVVYLVDITLVRDFNEAYKLTDPCTVMFFFRDKHIMVDMGTGNNNKITFAMTDQQDLIDIIEVVYRGARKGRGLVNAPKDYSTKLRY
jgi:U5 snRNP protein, DIM1 family